MCWKGGRGLWASEKQDSDPHPSWTWACQKARAIKNAAYKFAIGAGRSAGHRLILVACVMAGGCKTKQLCFLNRVIQGKRFLLVAEEKYILVASERWSSRWRYAIKKKKKPPPKTPELKAQHLFWKCEAEANHKRKTWKWDVVKAAKCRKDVFRTGHRKKNKRSKMTFS